MLTALQRKRYASGILEGRDRIDELNIPLTLERILQIIHAHSLIIHRNSDQSTAVIRANGIERANKAWIFADYSVPLIQKSLCVGLDSLLRTGGDQDSIAITEGLIFFTHPLFQCLLQRRIALTNPILQHAGRLFV